MGCKTNIYSELPNILKKSQREKKTNSNENAKHYTLQANTTKIHCNELLYISVNYVHFHKQQRKKFLNLALLYLPSMTSIILLYPFDFCLSEKDRYFIFSHDER